MKGQEAITLRGTSVKSNTRVAVRLKADELTVEYEVNGMYHTEPTSYEKIEVCNSINNCVYITTHDDMVQIPKEQFNYKAAAVMLDAKSISSRKSKIQNQ